MLPAAIVRPPVDIEAAIQVEAGGWAQEAGDRGPDDRLGSTPGRRSTTRHGPSLPVVAPSNADFHAATYLAMASPSLTRSAVTTEGPNSMPLISNCDDLSCPNRARRVRMNPSSISASEATGPSISLGLGGWSIPTEGVGVLDQLKPSSRASSEGTRSSHTSETSLESNSDRDCLTSGRTRRNTRGHFG